MFNEETVFILGAGASWHYGYPTGEQLVKNIILKARKLKGRLLELQNHESYWRNNYIPLLKQQLPLFILDEFERIGWETPNNIHKCMQKIVQECSDLHSRLEQTNAPVIDYFLEWNPQLVSIGKLLIAWELLEAESEYHHKDRDSRNWNRNRDNKRHGKDDWYRFVLYKLVSGCKQSSDLLKKNNVSFITFNYDLSLEQSLLEGLQSMQFLEENDIKKFFTSDRFIHVYGQIRNDLYQENFKKNFSAISIDETKDYIYSTNSYSQNFPEILKMKPLLDSAYIASESIKIIPHIKDDHKERLEIARKKIEEAKNVYILGFGFDKENCKRLGFQDLLIPSKAKEKNIFFTNMDDMDSINKRVNSIFSVKQDTLNNLEFYTGSKSVINIAEHHTLYERSTRDAYGALEKDFDFL